MPGSGYNSPNTKLARQMLDACRFIYKAYAQTCTYPLDPFFECHGDSDAPRSRLMEKIHAEYRTSSDVLKFDPVDYDLKKVPNPHEGVVYRGGIKTEPYILFQPLALDMSVNQVSGFDLDGKPVPYGNGPVAGEGRTRCAFFQGKTGMTKTWPKSGWASWLGAVLYDPSAQTATIVFRGSRSGNGGRALLGAKLHSRGSPDWVTDMNYLKGEISSQFHNAEMSVGFLRAYESCTKSVLAAFKEAVGSAPLRAIYVTGHSLGGALAQVCYLDLTCGFLAQNLIYGRQILAPITCFPISGPPIILGRESHEKIGLNADATQILHYFSAGDAVHCSPLLDTDLIPKYMRMGNWMLENFSHPMTNPIHLGTEIQLTTGSSFPESHEPRDVYKGLHGGTVDDRFWPEVKVNHLASVGPYITDLTCAGAAEQLRKALAKSLTPEMALARALQWHSVIVSDANKSRATEEIGIYQKATNLLAELGSRRVSEVAELAVRNTVKELRQRLLEGLDSGGDATKACYWTMLQGLAVQEYLAD